MNFCSPAICKKFSLYGAILLFFALNVAFLPLKGLKLDLTEENLFTPAEGTARILSKLSHPIDITVYASRDLLHLSPTHARFYERVRIILNDFSRLSKNRLSVRYINPEAFSEEEDQAVLDGVRSVNLNVSGQVGYFGILIARSSEGEETEALSSSRAIPFLNPQRESFFEYDLVKLINEVDRVKKLQIGFIGDANPFGNGRSAPWLTLQQLRNDYDIIPITQPSGLFGEGKPDFLWVVHPGKMEEAMLYAFEQYILAGGKAMVFVDPFYESILNDPGQFTGALTSPERSSTLDERLLKKWGISFNPEQIVTDGTYAAIIETSSPGNGRAPRPHLGWLNLRPPAISAQSVETFGLSSLILASAGAFQLLENGALTQEVFIFSSPQSSFTGKEYLSETPPNLVGLLEEFQPDETPKILSLRLQGEAETIFPDGPSKAVKNTIQSGLRQGGGEETAFPKFLQKSSTPINVVLVGDVDLLHDRFWAQQQSLIGQRFIQSFSGNGAFLLNIAESLSGEIPLSDLRNRTVKQRPFILIESLRLEAERRFRAREQALLEKLNGLENKLNGLDENANQEDVTQVEEEFTSELLTTRRELRSVQRNLGRDIDTLVSVIKIFTIGFMPFIIALTTLFVSLRRRRRWKTQLD